MKIVKKESASEQIINYIFGEISERRLKAGERLKNEKDFSELLGVSRVPLREAVCALSLLGIIDARQGEGTFINKYSSDMLARIMNIFMTLDDTSMENVLEMRDIMDIEAAKIAAIKCTNENIKEMREDIVNSRKFIHQINADTDKRKIFDIIINFHRIVARATQNKFFIQFLNSIHHSLQSYYAGKYEQDDKLIENLEQAIVEHVELLEAIAAHDIVKTTQLISRHVKYVRINIQNIDLE